MKIKGLLLILTLVCGYAQAQDTPGAMLRTRLEPAGPVLVGQPVRLHVDVLVTTWLTGAPEFPSLDIEGALVVLPEERATNLTERIENRTWFGLRRSYLIYPQEPREYQVPDAVVVVRYGQSSEPARLRLTQHAFRARIPEEARGLGYFIATTRLQIEQALDPKPSGLKTGDSIRRTITMEADGSFAMFLPPVKFESEDGLALYADPPRLEDRSEDRAGFQGGRRIDSATYVIEQEGSYRLPPVEIYWWDLESNRLLQATVPEVEFQAAPNPDFVPVIPLPLENEEAEVNIVEKETWLDVAKRWSIPAAAALVILFLLVRIVPGLIRRIQKRLKERRQRYENSEDAAYEKLLQANRSGNAQELFGKLYLWLDRMTPPGKVLLLKEFILREGNTTLQAEVETLEADLYGKEPAGAKQAERPLNYKILARTRKRILRHRTGRIPSSTVDLPDLNP